MVHGQSNKYSSPAPPILSPDDNLGLLEGAVHLMPMDIDTSGIVMSAGGAFFPQTLPHLDPTQHANDLPDSPSIAIMPTPTSKCDT